MGRRVGVIAIQGDFEKHVAAFQCAGAEAVPVRTPEELEGVDRAVIPGGESTTVGKLMERFGLGDALVERAKAGMPLWGTCMGLILMAKEIEGSDQYSLGLLDVTVRRNAFGAQVHSFEDSVEFEGLDTPLLAVFIRAPIVTRCGPKVEVLARYEDKTVAVRQGNLLGTSFHPEMTDDARLHELFIKW
ncbi:MAG TPA: pyridoxal 5'-phosphate synthase glutaminase subunit PdxT [Fimbriimonadaceae bacterium]|nr:pyridoxal 5'-phosphate synthase glutaminase subunit PdxT [Fimbriimonadaceae bacterium]